MNRRHGTDGHGTEGERGVSRRDGHGPARTWALVASVAASAALVAVGVGLRTGPAEARGEGAPRPGAAGSVSGSGTAADGYPGLPHSTVQISPDACGRGWTRAKAGLQVLDLDNSGAVTEDATVETVPGGAVLGQVEGLGTGTTRPVVVRLAAGTYRIRCLSADTHEIVGPDVEVAGGGSSGSGSGGGSGGGTPAVVPITVRDLAGPTTAYQRWVAAQLPRLASDAAVLRAAVDRGDLAAARTAWLPAHLDYERLGVAYGTFGPLDQAINGTTRGLVGGLSDPAFTGFHRLEYGLWHHQSAAVLAPVAARLTKDIAALRSEWPSARMDPSDLGVRAHEITENAIQFELTGRDDYGSGSGLATLQANLRGTAETLALLHPLLLRSQLPALPRIDAAMAAVSAQLRSSGAGSASPGRTAVTSLPLRSREQLNAAFGDLVTDLAPVAAICDAPGPS